MRQPAAFGASTSARAHHVAAAGVAAAVPAPRPRPRPRAPGRRRDRGRWARPGALGAGLGPGLVLGEVGAGLAEVEAEAGSAAGAAAPALSAAAAALTAEEDVRAALEAFPSPEAALQALPGPEAVLDALPEGFEAAADAADAAAQAAADPAVQEAAAKTSGLLGPLTDGLEAVLKTFQTGLDALHVPYSYGFSIILLTLLIKAATYPLTKQTVEANLRAQTLKPRIDLIKARYGDDKEKVQMETARLYEEAEVNPLAGCLPSLATIPVFLGLYRSLTNVASEGLLDTEGFFWIPSLAGPTSVAARQAGQGTAWLLPFVDDGSLLGAPPIGWDEAAPYLVLPVALVALQFLSSAIITPSTEPETEGQKVTMNILKLLPLMVGWFALNVPSGLSLYYFSNTVLTTAQQIYLRKLGGANVEEPDLPEMTTRLGAAKRTGSVLDRQEEAPAPAPPAAEAPLLSAAEIRGEAVDEAPGTEAVAGAAAAAAAFAGAPEAGQEYAPDLSRRCKRTRRAARPGSVGAEFPEAA